MFPYVVRPVLFIRVVIPLIYRGIVCVFVAVRFFVCLLVMYVCVYVGLALFLYVIRSLFVVLMDVVLYSGVSFVVNVALLPVFRFPFVLDSMCFFHYLWCFVLSVCMHVFRSPLFPVLHPFRITSFVYLFTVFVVSFVMCWCVYVFYKLHVVVTL